MLKINLPSAVLLALAFSHIGYSAENPAPSKAPPICKQCRTNSGGLKDWI